LKIYSTPIKDQGACSFHLPCFLLFLNGIPTPVIEKSLEKPELSIEQVKKR